MQFSDAHYKALAIEAIRQAHPTAVTATFETSDQNYYGFFLTGLIDSEGEEIEPTDAVQGEVNEYVEGLDWDGVMGEDVHGYASVELRER